MLFFTNRGRVFRLRTHEIPDVKRQAKGIPIINLIEVDQGEKVTALIDMEVFSDEQYLVMVTKLGQIKKTPAAAYAAVRRNGLIAINLQDDDELNWVRRSSGGDEVLVVTRQGKGSRFTEKEVRPMGRDTMGVGAIRLRKGDEVAGFDIVNPEGHVLVITENGFGKLTPMSDYPIKSRNIQGVYTVDQTAIPKIGEIVGMRVVEDLVRGVDGHLDVGPGDPHPARPGPHLRTPDPRRDHHAARRRRPGRLDRRASARWSHSRR